MHNLWLHFTAPWACCTRAKARHQRAVLDSRKQDHGGVRVREMRAWMVLLCMSCVLGGMAGAAIGLFLWFHNDKPQPQQSGTIHVQIHVVPSQVCKDNKPCMEWDTFKFDKDMNCSFSYYPKHPKTGVTIQSFPVPCDAYDWGIQ